MNGGGERAAPGKSYGENRAVDDVSFEVERARSSPSSVPTGRARPRRSRYSRDSGRAAGAGGDAGGRPGANRRRSGGCASRIGVVLQELAVEPFYSVRQVLTRNAGYYPSPRPVDEVIALVGLDEKADARVKTLSGGQQRRLDVGLGIVGHPELLFLDEPTTGLDPSGRRDSWELIRTLGLGGHHGAADHPLHGRGRGAGGQGGRARRTPRSWPPGPRPRSGAATSGSSPSASDFPKGSTAGDCPSRSNLADEGRVEIRTEDELRCSMR